jgi:hypothetical protein
LNSGFDIILDNAYHRNVALTQGSRPFQSYRHCSRLPMLTLSITSVATESVRHVNKLYCSKGSRCNIHGRWTRRRHVTFIVIRPKPIRHDLRDKSNRPQMTGVSRETCKICPCGGAARRRHAVGGRVSLGMHTKPPPAP